MRHLALWRLAALLLLTALPLAFPTLTVTAPVALADHGNGNNGNASGDHDKGHGNDPDGVDEDNPGKSKDNKGKSKDKEKEKNAGEQVETVPAAGYAVAVDCRPAGDTTTCDVTATAPAGAKKVNFVQAPAAAICADVVETDAKFSDPDPHTHITGYTSRGSRASLSLVLEGEVTVAGTTTWWIKAANNVLPVEGPGLACETHAATAPTVTVAFDVTPAATEAPATGTVTVDVLTCGEVPADTTGFDWFGACQPGANPARNFALAPGDDSAPPVTATTNASGAATFAEVAPGNYRLDLVDGSWCHANADRVTADSEVVVEAGATSTVWIFLCDRPAGV
jgi:hypothetical protein